MANDYKHMNNVTLYMAVAYTPSPKQENPHSTFKLITQTNQNQLFLMLFGYRIGAG